jgi:hypothetical protein
MVVPRTISRSINVAGVARKAACAGFLALAAAASLALPPVSMPVSAQAARSNESELKAAFLYNFIKFTEWPAEQMANKSAPFVIGVLGRDPLGAALDKTIEGESFHQKPIVIRRFARLDESALQSHALFISASEESHLPMILKLLDGQAILTVSDIENFAQRGGGIQLKKESNKIVFEINIEAARRAGLAIHAQLLKLAKVVKK